MLNCPIRQKKQRPYITGVGLWILMRDDMACKMLDSRVLLGLSICHLSAGSGWRVRWMCRLEQQQATHAVGIGAGEDLLVLRLLRLFDFHLCPPCWALALRRGGGRVGGTFSPSPL